MRVALSAGFALLLAAMLPAAGLSAQPFAPGGGGSAPGASESAPGAKEPARGRPDAGRGVSKQARGKSEEARGKGARGKGEQARGRREQARKVVARQSRLRVPRRAQHDTPAAPRPAEVARRQAPAPGAQPVTAAVEGLSAGRTSAPLTTRGSAPASSPRNTGPGAGTRPARRSRQSAGERASARARSVAGRAERRQAGTRASRRRASAAPTAPERRGPPGVVRRVRDIVEVVPGPLKVALAGLILLSALLLGGYLMSALRSRRLARQRHELLQDVGLLQAALLPPVPGSIGSVAVSVAYRPSDGPGAGGDFYDAVALPGGRAGFVLGDVSGHGREALSHTAFMRHTLRAYLEAGLEPRVALQVADRVAGAHLGGDFATAIIAVHDPKQGTLTYAAAGHPAPIVLGESGHDPVIATSSPPIGWNLPTGLRQTTIPLAAGSRAFLYTDGLEEAPTGHGELLGRDRLTEIAAGCGPDASAAEILDRVVSEASEARDDMAACLIIPAAEVTSHAVRSEQLELFGADTDADLLTGFLAGCGVPALEAARARAQAATQVRLRGGALVTVHLGDDETRVEVLPRDIESIEAASRRPTLAALDG